LANQKNRTAFSSPPPRARRRELQTGGGKVDTYYHIISGGTVINAMRPPNHGEAKFARRNRRLSRKVNPESPCMAPNDFFPASKPARTAFLPNFLPTRISTPDKLRDVKS